MTNERFQNHYISCRGVTGKVSSESSYSEAAPACMMPLQTRETNFLHINMGRRRRNQRICLGWLPGVKATKRMQVFVISLFFGLFVFRRTFFVYFSEGSKRFLLLQWKIGCPCNVLLESPQCKISFNCHSFLTLKFRNDSATFRIILLRSCGPHEQ